MTVVAVGFSTPRIAMHMCLERFAGHAEFWVAITTSAAPHPSEYARAIDKDGNACGLHELLDGLPDLRSEPLLDLEALGEKADEARKLGEACVTWV